MADKPDTVGQSRVLQPARLGDLLESLRTRGYELVGPTVRDGAIIYDTISGPADLPVGWTDEHGAGNYRLRRRDDEALFGYTVGPHSWKKFLFPPAALLWRASRDADGITIADDDDDVPRFAFIGVRPCELAAISILDRVLLQGEYTDPNYATRRRQAFIVAVNCAQPGGTCFCSSMNTGPEATGGFDLCLTEVIGSDAHYLLAKAGTEAGETVLADLPVRTATEEEMAAAAAVCADAAAHMGRTVDTTAIRDLLYRNAENARWNETATRCLACANCTMVCPTCFCSTVEDTTDLAGTHAERRRVWDSCFTADFSYLHGGSIRRSVRARYRQWLTHKLAAWQDQFGVSGCVGCGRCITWCPAGIDITEEIEAIRARDIGAPPVADSKETVHGDA